MANLKEIRGRIGSVSTTLKITSSMSLIASAKLHAAQVAIGNMVPYEEKLHDILERLMRSGVQCGDIDVLRSHSVDGCSLSGEPSLTAVVLVTSNQSLCGSFNANLAKAFDALGLDPQKTVVYAVGKYGLKHVTKAGFHAIDCCHLSGSATFEASSDLAQTLCAEFLSGRYDRVELLYSHFVSVGSQKVISRQYLPFVLPEVEAGQEERSDEDFVDVILEPGAGAMLEMLVPKLVKLGLHTVLMDAATAEHAARTMAMQTATDNAKDLLSELSLQYNKLRQQAITAEILDLLGGQTNI